jgi:NAD(P)-dependent dehydrogenase (short-subunit alcohol dehydrogenase family)
MLLEGRTAIVSGIGPGMGRDISLRLAREGADLVLAARTEAKLEEVAAEVEALGRRALCVPTDLAQPDDCRGLVEKAASEFGEIDVLVNNAFHTGTMTPFEDDDLEVGWRETHEVNLWGTLRVTQAVLPIMKAQQRGSIVMINTMTIRVVNPGFAAYASSKAALEAATRGIAKEVGPYGIRVNSVMPGFIWGASVKSYFEARAAREGRSYQEIHDEVASAIPLRRIPDSEEISGSVLFFASDLSSCVTGQSLDVNGGQVMY